MKSLEEAKRPGLPGTMSLAWIKSTLGIMVTAALSRLHTSLVSLSLLFVLRLWMTNRQQALRHHYLAVRPARDRNHQAGSASRHSR